MCHIIEVAGKHWNYTSILQYRIWLTLIRALWEFRRIFKNYKIYIVTKNINFPCSERRILIPVTKKGKSGCVRIYNWMCEYVSLHLCQCMCVRRRIFELRQRVCTYNSIEHFKTSASKTAMLWAACTSFVWNCVSTLRDSFAFIWSGFLSTSVILLIPPSI